MFRSKHYYFLSSLFIFVSNAIATNSDFQSDYEAIIFSHIDHAAEPINLSFKSFGRLFNLTLQKSNKSTYLNSSFETDSDQEINKYLNLYEGFLADQPTTSHAKGILVSDSFLGTIHSDVYGKFSIEPPGRYTKTTSNIDAVIRRDDGPYKKQLYSKRSSSILESLEIVDTRSVWTTSDTELSTMSCAAANATIDLLMSHELNSTEIDSIESESFSYLIESNRKDQTAESKKQKRREFPDGRSVCNLYLKVDPFLYQEVYANEGNSNEQMTITYLLFFLNQQVEFLNSVYGQLKFFDSQNKSYYQGLKFMIHRTKLISFKDCDEKNTTLSKEDLELCKPNIDVFDYLNKVSYDDYSEYCLGYTFTARDFKDGTLGLAWTAENRDSVGGACKNNRLTRSKSYNSGIVTVTNYRMHSPEIASRLAFAHEVGHSLGADHDPLSKRCSPGSSHDGNYLMYRKSNPGIYKNNRLFSECSKRRMGQVMHTLVDNPNKFCFKKFDGPLCGNGVLEEGEECDCGFREDCIESCCHSASEEDEQKRCKLKPTAKCSPSQGVCCDNTCQFKAPETVCTAVNECTKQVNCTGDSYKCPNHSVKAYKKDFTLCDNGAKVCQKGKCKDSVCSIFGLTECSVDNETDRWKLCLLACVGELTKYQCEYSHDIPEMMKHSRGLNFTLPPGTTCMNGKGVCDLFSRCRPIDYEGPLTKIFLHDKSIYFFTFFIENFSWSLMVLLIGLLFVFCIVYSLRSPIDKRKIRIINKNMVKRRR